MQTFWTATHLLFVTRQKIIGHYWKDPISTVLLPSTSDIVSQHNKIEGITFRNPSQLEQ